MMIFWKFSTYFSPLLSKSDDHNKFNWDLLKAYLSKLVMMTRILFLSLLQTVLGQKTLLIEDIFHLICSSPDLASVKTISPAALST